MNISDEVACGAVVVTSAKELDALPVGSVVVGADFGEVYQKLARHDGIKWYQPGDELSWESLELNLPAGLLHLGTTGRHNALLDLTQEDREGLAGLIARRRYAKATRPAVWITGRAALEVADVILSAGYRKVALIARNDAGAGE
jgi:hypothetical protein